jgi:hypothetical protein
MKSVSRYGLTIVGFLALAAMACPPAVADTNVLLAGAARVEVTPDPKLTNWVGHRPYAGVLDPIFARALVLSSATNQAAILCWDLVDAREGVVAKVRQRIARDLGLAQSNILVAASHTHSAPWSPVISDPLLAQEQKDIGPVMRDPAFQTWADRLIESSVEVVRQASAAQKPVTLAIGRAYVGEVVFNRRPRKPDGKVETMIQPANPYALPRGLRFGPTDPTLTLLSFRDSDGRSVATLFHLACHPVAIYPFHKGISPDWPGLVAIPLEAALGGRAIFLQGCAGDIVPARRGLEAADRMARLIAERALAALKQAEPLPAGPLRVLNATASLPLTEAARKDMQQDRLAAEVQVLACGPLALVALPGEPLIGLAFAIQQRSPFPHTLVLGYANGYGVQYVGLPGEKARGGYEMGPVGAGTDECGRLLVDTAVRLLQEQWERAAPPPSVSP